MLQENRKSEKHFEPFMINFHLQNTLIPGLPGGSGVRKTKRRLDIGGHPTV